MTKGIPKLRQHKGTQRGYVRHPGTGKEIYLGPWPRERKKAPPETLGAYEAWLKAFLFMGDDGAQAKPVDPSCVTIAVLVAKYLEHCESYYSKQKNNPGETAAISSACLPLVKRFADVPVGAVLPWHLAKIHEDMKQTVASSQGVAKRLGLIRRCFRWGAREGLVPVSVLVGFGLVKEIQTDAGRTQGPKTAKTPQSRKDVELVISLAPPVLKGLLIVVLESGARPAEIAKLTPRDIDRSYSHHDVWVATPTNHKTRHKGKARVIGLNQRCQAAILPFLEGCPEDKPIFSPRRALLESWQARSKAKQITKAAQKRLESIKDHYDKFALNRAVARLCEKAFGEDSPRAFSPYSLRKIAADDAQETLGDQGAATLLGHASPEVTRKHYLKKPDASKVIEAVKALELNKRTKEQIEKSEKIEKDAKNEQSEQVDLEQTNKTISEKPD